MLFPRDHSGDSILPTPNGDLLLRYVPLHKASAISVEFDSGRVFAVLSHRNEHQHTSFYNKVDDDTLCMHCPLSSNENIEALWIVRHKNLDLNMGVRALIVSWNSSVLSLHIDSRIGEDPRKDCLARPLLLV